MENPSSELVCRSCEENTRVLPGLRGPCPYAEEIYSDSTDCEYDCCQDCREQCRQGI